MTDTTKANCASVFPATYIGNRFKRIFDGYYTEHIYDDKYYTPKNELGEYESGEYESGKVYWIYIYEEYEYGSRKIYIFKNKIDALKKNYKDRNNFLNKIIQDCGYMSSKNTRKTRKRQKNYINLRRKTLIFFNIPTYGYGDERYNKLVNYAKENYTSLEKFEDVYDDYRELLMDKLKRLYLRVILSSRTNTTNEPFINFFKMCPGLCKFIGLILIKYI